MTDNWMHFWWPNHFSCHITNKYTCVGCDIRAVRGLVRLRDIPGRLREKAIRLDLPQAAGGIIDIQSFKLRHRSEKQGKKPRYLTSLSSRYLHISAITEHLFSNLDYIFPFLYTFSKVLLLSNFLQMFCVECVLWTNISCPEAGKHG